MSVWSGVLVTELTRQCCIHTRRTVLPAACMLGRMQASTTWLLLLLLTPAVVERKVLRSSPPV